MNPTIRVVRPDGKLADILPDWKGLSYLDSATEVGQVNFEYPDTGKRASMLEEGNEYALVIDGKEAPNGRFRLQETDGNRIHDGVAFTKWTGSTLLDRFDEAVIGPVTDKAHEPPKDKDDDNKKKGPKPAVPPYFKADTAGQILRYLFQEAKGRGALREISLGFTAEKDSNGRKWSDKASPEWEVGTTLLEVIQWLTENATAEFRMVGRQLQGYDMGTIAPERGSEATVAPGKNMLDGPVQGGTKDLVTAVIAVSSRGPHGWVNDDAAVKEFGRIEGKFGAEVKELPQLKNAAERYLKAFAKRRRQYTYGVIPGKGADPYTHYQVGQWINVAAANGAVERQRVREIGISWEDNASTAKIALVLNDVILERQVKQAQTLQRAAGRTGGTSGLQGGTDQPAGNADGYAPYKPSEPVVTTRAGSVRVAYDGLDFEGDEPQFDQSHVEVHVSAEADDFEPTPETLIDTIQVNGGIFLSAADLSLVYGADPEADPYTATAFVKFVAIDVGGDRSEPSDPVLISPASISYEDLDPGIINTSDGDPPSFSPDPTAFGGTGALYVKWDAVPNADSVTYDVHVSAVTPVVVDATTLAGSVDGTVIGFALDPGTYHVAVVARDVDGAAAPSIETSADVTAPVDLTDVETAIDTLVTVTLPGLQSELDATNATIAGLGTADIAGLDVALNALDSQLLANTDTLDVLTTTTLPGLTSDIAANDAAIDNLTSVTLPALSATVSGLGDELAVLDGRLDANDSTLDTLNTVTLPGLTDDLSALEGKFPIMPIDVGFTIGGGNLVTNSNFAIGPHNAFGVWGWIPRTGASYYGRVTDDPYFGPGALRVNVDSTDSFSLRASGVYEVAFHGPEANHGAQVTPGEILTVTAWMRARTSAPAVAAVGFEWTNDVTYVGEIGSAYSAPLSQTVWTAVRFTTTVPSGVTQALARVEIGGDDADVTIGAVQIERGDLPTSYAPKPDEILPGTINTVEIGTDAITAPKIVAGSIIAGKIAADAISANEIQAGAITASELAANSVTAAAILAGTITATQIAAGTITATQIASNTLTANEIAAGAITASEIATWAITADKVSAGAISTEKLTVTASNLVDDPGWEFGGTGWETYGNPNVTVVTDAAEAHAGDHYLRIVSNGGNTDVYQQGFIPVTPGEVFYTENWARGLGGANGYALPLAFFGYDKSKNLTQYLAPFGTLSGDTAWTKYGGTFEVPAGLHYLRPWLSVRTEATAGEYHFDGFVFRRMNTVLDIVDGAVVADKIAAGSITTAKIVAGAVTATEIATGAITAIKIDAGAVTTGKIAAGAVTANEIAADAITANKILAGSVTAEKLTIGSLRRGLLLNGSFEEYDPVTNRPLSWNMVEVSGPTPTFNSDPSSGAVTGSRILSIGPTGSGYAGVGSTPVPVVPGRTYFLRGNIAVSDTTQAGYVIVRTVYGTAHNGTWPTTGFAIGLDQWTGYGGIGGLSPVSYTWTAPAGAKWACVEIISYTSGTAYVFADDFQLDEQTVSVQIADGAVTANKIVAHAITANEIAAGTITALEIATGAITAVKIDAGAVTTVKLDAEAVTAAKIKAGTITANEIATGAITAIKIDAGAVTASKLSADAIDGKTITGAIVRTAATGTRMIMRDDGAGGVLEGFGGLVGESPTVFDPSPYGADYPALRIETGQTATKDDPVNLLMYTGDASSESAFVLNTNTFWVVSNDNPITLQSELLLTPSGLSVSANTANIFGANGVVLETTDNSISLNAGSATIILNGDLVDVNGPLVADTMTVGGLLTSSSLTVGPGVADFQGLVRFREPISNPDSGERLTINDGLTVTGSTISDGGFLTIGAIDVWSGISNSNGTNPVAINDDLTISGTTVGTGLASFNGGIKVGSTGNGFSQMKWGVVSTPTDGSGLVNVTHGGGSTPTLMMAQNVDSGRISSATGPTSGSTTFRVFTRVLTTAGAPVLASTNTNFYWIALWA